MPKKNMDKNINEYIGKRIQEIRIEKGLKQDYIAEKTGINTMTAEDPMTAVAIGTGKYVEFLAGYRED